MSIRLLATLLVLSLVPVSLPGAMARCRCFSGTVAPAPMAQEIHSLAVARDPQGQLWAAWEADSGTDAEIYFSYQTGGAWSPAEPVHIRPDAWDRWPSLAISVPEGEIWLAWTSSPRSDPNRREIYASRWAGGAWTEPQVVPTGDDARPADASLAAAPDGALWLAWRGFDGDDMEIFASRWDGRSWSQPWQVSADKDKVHRNDFYPRLIVTGDGQPWLAWVGHHDGPDSDLYASRWTGAEWTDEQMINRDDDDLDTRPSLALGPDGQPWLAWTAQVASGERLRRRILFARWNPSLSAWTPEQLVSSSPDLPVDEEAPSLVVDGQGRAHLAWIATAGGATALAHALWTGAGWTEAQAIGAGAPAGALALEPGDGQPTLLWLDPPASPAPLAQAAVKAADQPLAAWIDSQPAPAALLVDPILNRYVAFGDSITLGAYNSQVWTPYPARLDYKLDIRVRPSEVINSGVSGERTNQGAARIGGVVSNFRPKYILIMEGTNDVTARREPGEVYVYLDDMIYNARHAGVDHVKPVLATLIPRVDGLNDETQLMNLEAIIPLANAKSIPLCHQYQAFEDYGNYEQLFWDDVHPNGEGLQLMSDTWYSRLVAVFSEIFEDTTAPTPTLNDVPPETECLGNVTVSWSGYDNLEGTGMANFDVQFQVDAGPWTDWQMATTALAAVYSGVTWGHTYSFHVRARDLAGNVSDYTPPGSTQVIDSVPPYEAHVKPLPAARKAPFAVYWGGSDACSGVATYDVEYNVDGGAWQPWLAGTPGAGGVFNPASPQYGHTYYFHARAYDQASNVGAWSTPVSIVLARYTLGGGVLTVREEPVAGALVTLTPAVLAVEPRPGGYLAYLAGSGVYDVWAGRAGFGALPPMLDVTVAGDVSGADLFLPPLDNAVVNGGFEVGNLSDWQIGGAVTPTLAPVAHTGGHSVQLGDVTGSSTISQTVSPPLGLSLAVSDPTLSFLVRLAEEPGSPGDLQVLLSGAVPVTYSLAVESDAWSHVWYDLTGLVSSPMTITFVVSGSPPVLVDEISLGSAVRGAYRAYLPLILRGW